MAVYNNYSSDLWSAHSGPGTTYMILSCSAFFLQEETEAQRAPATCLEVTQLARNRIRIWLQAFLLQSHFSGAILLFACASRTMGVSQKLSPENWGLLCWLASGRVRGRRLEGKQRGGQGISFPISSSPH